VSDISRLCAFYPSQNWIDLYRLRPAAVTVMLQRLDAMAPLQVDESRIGLLARAIAQMVSHTVRKRSHGSRLQNKGGTRLAE
jgi:hypothetical protein